MIQTSTGEERAQAGAVMGKENQEKALKSLDSLPPFSPALQKLLATLASEDVSYVALTQIVENDTVLAGNILRVVNSALYGISGTVNSVGRGIALIGLNKLRNLALSLSVGAMWSKVNVSPHWSMSKFNLQAISTAILTDQIALRTIVRYPECGFTAGLLHDLGRLLIATALPCESEQIDRLSASSGEDVEWCERYLTGVTHSALSAAALRRWKLPEPICEAVARHHEPVKITKPLELYHAVGMADCVVNSTDGKCAALDELLGEDSVARVMADHQKELEAIRSFF